MFTFPGHEKRRRGKKKKKKKKTMGSSCNSNPIPHVAERHKDTKPQKNYTLKSYTAILVSARHFH